MQAGCSRAATARDPNAGPGRSRPSCSARRGSKTHDKHARANAKSPPNDGTTATASHVRWLPCLAPWFGSVSGGPIPARRRRDGLDGPTRGHRLSTVPRVSTKRRAQPLMRATRAGPTGAVPRRRARHLFFFLCFCPAAYVEDGRHAPAPPYNRRRVSASLHSDGRARQTRRSQPQPKRSALPASAPAQLPPCLRLPFHRAALPSADVVPAGVSGFWVGSLGVGASEDGRRQR